MIQRYVRAMDLGWNKAEGYLSRSLYLSESPSPVLELNILHKILLEQAYVHTDLTSLESLVQVRLKWTPLYSCTFAHVSWLKVTSKELTYIRMYVRTFPTYQLRTDEVDAFFDKT